MATFSIVLIPEDKHFTPSYDAIVAAKCLMEEYFPDRENPVWYRLWPRQGFVTVGDAFEKFTCPKCYELVERFELEEDDDGATWWDHFEEKLHGSDDPANARICMPCCSNEVIAANIDFGKQAYFTQFKLWLHETGSDDSSITEEQKSKLEKILGCKLVSLIDVNS